MRTGRGAAVRGAGMGPLFAADARGANRGVGAGRHDPLVACGPRRAIPRASATTRWMRSLRWGLRRSSPSRPRTPGLIDDAGFRRWYERALRLGAAPDVQRRRFLAACNTNVRGVLGSVRTPTLVVAHQGARVGSHRRYLADHVPGARLVELEGYGSILSCIDPRPILDATEETLSPTIAVLPSLIGCSPDRVVHRPRWPRRRK